MKNILKHFALSIGLLSTCVASSSVLASDDSAGLKVNMRYRETNLTLAAGEAGFVVATCKAGEVVTGGGLTGYAPTIRVLNSTLTADGLGSSGWLVDVVNATNATITTEVRVTAICVKGRYTISNVDR
jgi:hypothetical protein